MTTAAPVRIRLLGEVACAGADDLGYDRQRCVLAVLLVDAGRAVPVPVLLDRAWGHRQPQRPCAALYSVVSRLRRALTHVGLGLAKHRDGYRIDLDPATVDLHRFHQLVRGARTEPDDRRAYRQLDQALALWRGDAFGSLDTPWLNALRHDLHRRRVSAERDRDDLALRLGHHADILDRLLTSAAREPFDERLTGQVMLALYRCGEPAQALRRYERLRRRLRDELGAHPGEPLRRLHQQILTAHPVLAPPAGWTTGRFDTGRTAVGR